MHQEYVVLYLQDTGIIAHKTGRWTNLLGDTRLLWVIFPQTLKSVQIVHFSIMPNYDLLYFVFLIISDLVHTVFLLF